MVLTLNFGQILCGVSIFGKLQRSGTMLAGNVRDRTHRADGPSQMWTFPGGVTLLG